MVLSVASLFLGSSIALADSYGTGGTDVGRIPDNHDHDWCWSTGWPGGSWDTDATNRHINLENQTLFGGGSNQSCDSGTDVYWKAGPIVQRGTYVCNDLFSGICDNASVTINTDTAILPSGGQRQKTMCHELGHSGGLAHYSGVAFDCMVSGSSTLIHYRPHAVGHLDALA
ncbi:MAG: hypothetical protein WC864_01640 [Ilumatobacteraceae bacterium]